MGTLSAFMKQNAKPIENEEIVVSNRFIDRKRE